MEKEFVPYELAVKLKELGYEADAFAYYDEFEDLLFEYNSNIKLTEAPLFQQAFNWFRETYNYDGNIMSSVLGWSVSVYEHHLFSEDTYNLKNITGHPSKHYMYYEEAQQACLEKLITLI